MQKIRKILRAVSERTALPTNEPTNQPTNYQQHQFYRTWLTPVQQIQDYMSEKQFKVEKGKNVISNRFLRGFATEAIF